MLAPPTHRFQRAVVGGRSVGSPKRPRGRLRKIATSNYSTQARLLLRRLIPINTPFPTTARWKLCVPGFISTAVVDGVHSLLNSFCSVMEFMGLMRLVGRISPIHNVPGIFRGRHCNE